MRKPTMITRREYIERFQLSPIQQINGEIHEGRLKIEHIVSMQESRIDNDRLSMIVLFYAE